LKRETVAANHRGDRPPSYNDKGKTMKVAFTTSGDSLDSAFDQRFGRAPKFLVYDTTTESFEIADNAESVEAAQGAGIKAADKVARMGVESLVTANCGPKAFEVLQAAGVKVYSASASTVSEALKQFSADRLEEMGSANRKSHWE